MKHMSGPAPTDTASIGRKRGRVPYWDNVKFVLIFLVVLGHFLYSREDLRIPKLLTLGIYTFHMPAFAFVSGFLSASWTRENLAKKLPSLARLVVAYVVFNGIFVLYAAYVGGDVNLTIPYYSFWYIIALCVWRLTVGYVGSFGLLGLVLSVAAALLVGFWQDVDNVFAVGRTIAFYPFFLTGYLLPRSWGERLSELRPITRVLFGGLLAVASVVAIGGSWWYLRYSDNDVLMGPYTGMADAKLRAVLFGVAILATLAILLLTPGRHVPLLTAVGEHSLTIYVLHRFFVLLFERLVAPSASSLSLVGLSLAGTVVLLALLGNTLVHRLFTGFVDRGASLLTRAPSKGFLSLASKAICLVMCVAVSAAPVWAMMRQRETSEVVVPEEVSRRRLGKDEQAALNDSYSILLAGDLVLLEDQVRRGYTGEGYDFSDVFEPTTSYISQADLAIGVLEGPCAGAEALYSQGDFDDAKPMWMNFPDEFATAIKNAGFDLVTTANNHLLDRGEEGALRTLDVLDEVGLGHVGSYRSASEKQESRIKVVEVEDLRLAVLAYTYGANEGDSANLPDSSFVGGEYEYLTSVIVNPRSSSFAACKEAVEADLAAARELGCDLIVVLPHWGTQFSFEVDSAQAAWREVFLAGGADIILGAHAHVVQPIVMEERDGRMTVTCYCPGNFTDVYTKQNVDAGSLIEVRVSKSTKQVVGGDVIPLWTSSTLSGNYRPAPIWDIMHDEALTSQVSTRDLERVAEAYRLETSVLLGQALELSEARPRLYFTEQGFGRQAVSQVQLSDAARAGQLYTALVGAGNVCFVGDGITSGAKNGGYGWYEPFESLVEGELCSVSAPGLTTPALLEMADQLIDAKADLYVVAIGANDVRYRDDTRCAMTSEAYVSRLSELVDAVRASLPDARFVFVAPWTSTAGDVETPLMVGEKRAMNAAYAEALKAFCEAGGHGYANPSPAIEEVIDSYRSADYLVDVIHPNSTEGLQLYARAALEG